MNKKYLFLDDERLPKDVTWIYFEKLQSWNIVRSYDEAVKWVIENGFPDVVSFDHDLGMQHYAEDYSDGKTGYDFAKWLIDYDVDNNLMPSDFTFTVHSMNPVGAENIRQIMNNYLDFKLRGKYN